MEFPLFSPLFPVFPSFFPLFLNFFQIFSNFFKKLCLNSLWTQIFDKIYRKKDRETTISIDNISIADEDKDLEKDIINKSDISNIKVALANLNQDYQDVIVWYYLDDFPIARVADLSGKSEANTRVLIHRALSSLREKIKEV